MFNPLNTVPLNTRKVYVRGVTLDGCKIYMPVDSHLPETHQLAKKCLQAYLDQQYIVPGPNKAA